MLLKEGLLSPLAQSGTIAVLQMGGEGKNFLHPLLASYQL